MTGVDGPGWVTRTDVAILEELQEQRLEYVALIADRRGLHLSFAKKRCRMLERHGFIERTTDEVTYRITAEGERYLANSTNRGLSIDERTSFSDDA